jgi:hypothetical protein
MTMRRFLRENGLSLGFGAIFLAALVAEAFVGHSEFNHEQLAHHAEPVSLGRYLTSSAFGSDVMENWQSEYLQFTLFILGTIWLLQRGSPESKELDRPGRETERQQRIGRHARGDSPLWARAGGWRTALYSNSLLLVMGSIWLATWAVQAITGHVAYNDDQVAHHEPTTTVFGYLGTSDFWNRTLQNWQSEFLAVGSMAILAVYLRQRGSPESKPVGAPDEATGVEG